MNWEAIGAVGEILGAGAVFISLGYLAVQLKHASIATRYASQNTFVSEYSRILERLYADPGFTDLIQKTIRQGMGSLDRNEQHRVHAYLAAQQLATFNLYVQLQEDLFDARIGEPLINFFATVCKSGGAKEWWTLNKAVSDQEFVADIDSRINDPDLPTLEVVQPWYGPD